MRRWARLACRCSPVMPFDGSARVYAPRPERPPRLVAACGAYVAPCGALHAVLQSTVCLDDRVALLARFQRRGSTAKPYGEDWESPRRRAARVARTRLGASRLVPLSFSAVLPLLSPQSRQRVHGMMTNLRFHIFYLKLATVSLRAPALRHDTSTTAQRGACGDMCGEPHRHATPWSVRAGAGARPDIEHDMPHARGRDGYI